MTGQITTKDSIKIVDEVSLLELFSKNNLVIPEIQREYVWGHPVIGKYVLGGFYQDFLKKVRAFSLAGDNVGKLQDQKVGFVYAYIPGFAKDGAERTLPLPAYLIDGQQRVTTFFLMWLHLASKAKKISDFLDAIRYGKGDMAFAFKVRPLTHDFLATLVRQVVESDGFEFSSIEDGTWFLSEYGHDISVMSMVNALKSWDAVWAENGLDAGLAYKYLTRHVKFWRFIMKETAEGQQLYITMNGRGKNLSEDEIIRAKVFRDAVTSGKRVATEVGALFESMTDFFWTHRVKDELDADKGMKKFFRWVYLLERYDAGAKDEFSKWLTNDGNRTFVLEESMFGKDDATSKPRITFGLIESTFTGLLELYKEDSAARPYLRNSVLGEADDDWSFHRDCFCVLPLLHWLNKLSERKTLPDPIVLGWFARYLCKMASWQDMGEETVRNAIHFADAFLEFGRNDPIAFLARANTGNHRLSAEVLPDEEVAKARRLLELRKKDKDLFEKFYALLEEIEFFKSVGKDGLEQLDEGEESFPYDYRIASFLDLKEDWRLLEWDNSLLKFYRTAFERFKRFWTKRNPLRKFRMLVTPEVGGYYVKNMKLFPHELVAIMDDKSIVDKIIKFEQAVDKMGEDAAFDVSERKYLAKHWETIITENDPRTLCAVALILQQLSGTKRNDNWIKVQYQNSNDEKVDVDPKFRPIGDGAFYFWFQNAPKKWLYSAARDTNLLQYHKMTAEEADQLVRGFLDNQDNC